jgi:hypothetical protein
LNTMRHHSTVSAAIAELDSPYTQEMKNTPMCFAAAAALVVCAHLQAKVIHAPELAIEQAIKIARGYADAEKIDLSHHFLAAVEYKNLHNEYEKPFWRVEWRMLAGTTSGQLVINVSSDGTASSDKESAAATSAPRPQEPDKPSEAANLLSAYPRSQAFAENVAWHKHVGNNEIRMSWFLGGDPGVAMVCTADLAANKVTTSREVHDHASQSSKTRELSDAQVLTLNNLIKNLPPSAKGPELKNLILVSVVEKGQAKTYLYDRLNLHQDIVRLHDLTGAYLSTDPVP